MIFEYPNVGKLDRLIDMILSGEKQVFVGNINLERMLIAGRLIVALNILHKQHIYHRNLTPDCIFFNRAPEDQYEIVKFNDFSFSKQQLDSGTQSSFKQTPFIAPEALENQYSEKSDVYSLGCIIYYAFTKKPPFEGKIG